MKNGGSSRRRVDDREATGRERVARREVDQMVVVVVVTEPPCLTDAAAAVDGAKGSRALSRRSRLVLDLRLGGRHRRLPRRAVFAPSAPAPASAHVTAKAKLLQLSSAVRFLLTSTEFVKKSAARKLNVSLSLSVSLYPSLPLSLPPSSVSVFLSVSLTALK